MNSISNQIEEIKKFIEVYNEPPYGREVQGTVELLEAIIVTIEKLMEKSEHTVVTDGITNCCGYDFCTDGFDPSIHFCPRCGAEIVKKNI